MRAFLSGMPCDVPPAAELTSGTAAMRRRSNRQQRCHMDAAADVTAVNNGSHKLSAALQPSHSACHAKRYAGGYSAWRHSCCRSCRGMTGGTEARVRRLGNWRRVGGRLDALTEAAAASTLVSALAAAPLRRRLWLLRMIWCVATSLTNDLLAKAGEWRTHCQQCAGLRKR